MASTTRARSSGRIRQATAVPAITATFTTTASIPRSTILQPWEQTYALGVNDLGEIVGLANDGIDAHGFLYSKGNYLRLNDPFPGAFGTEPIGINNLSQIVGSYTYNNASHGFLYDNGVYTTIDVPLADGTYALGINDRGQIVGTYVVGNTLYAFLATP